MISIENLEQYLEKIFWSNCNLCSSICRQLRKDCSIHLAHPSIDPEDVDQVNLFEGIGYSLADEELIVELNRTFPRNEKFVRALLITGESLISKELTIFCDDGIRYEKFHRERFLQTLEAGIEQIDIIGVLDNSRFDCSFNALSGAIISAMDGEGYIFLNFVGRG